MLSVNLDMRNLLFVKRAFLSLLGLNLLHGIFFPHDQCGNSSDSELGSDTCSPIPRSRDKKMKSRHFIPGFSFSSLCRGRGKFTVQRLLVK